MVIAKHLGIETVRLTVISRDSEMARHCLQYSVTERVRYSVKYSDSLKAKETH